MGIDILPPDINEGESGFSVSGSSIRYALTAIKSVGRPVITAVVEERKERGPFLNLQDFVNRITDKDVNKRAVESFIKAGALDGLGGTRKQFMSVFSQVMDRTQKDRKNNMAGQLSLFDIVEEEEKEGLALKLPDVGEYPKEMKLAFEKEVLGIYVSGHPLEEYEAAWRKKISNTTADFAYDEEVQGVRVKDGAKAVIGGLIAGKTIKYTKDNKIMAFLTIEDLVGTVEVIVFPKTYEQSASFLTEDAKVFVQGRISVEEDKDGKLICEKIVPFTERKKKVWIKFPDMEAYKAAEAGLMDTLRESEGKDGIVIYIENPKAKKELPPNQNVEADESLVNRLQERFGRENVTVTVS